MCCPPNIQQKTIENINHETQSHLMVASLLGEPQICYVGLILMMDAV